MMKTIYKMSLMLIILLFLSSCTGLGGGSTGRRQLDFTPKGTTGITMTIPDLTTEDIVIKENQNINVFGIFKNTNSPDTSCMYSVHANEKRIAFSDGKAVAKSEFTLPQRGKDNLDGSTTSVNFRASIKELSGATKEAEVEMFHSLCCDYSQTVDTSITLDPKPLDESGFATQSISLSSCQGGPVCLTKIRSTMIPEDNGVRAQLRLSFANRKQGDVYRHGIRNAFCSGVPLSEDDFGVVDVISVRIPGMNIECESNTVQLLIPQKSVEDEDEDGKPTYTEETITCTGIIPDIDEAIPTNIIIDYNYGYKDSFKETITIEKA